VNNPAGSVLVQKTQSAGSMYTQLGPDIAPVFAQFGQTGHRMVVDKWFAANQRLPRDPAIHRIAQALPEAHDARSVGHGFRRSGLAPRARKNGCVLHRIAPYWPPAKNNIVRQSALPTAARKGLFAERVGVGHALMRLARTQRLQRPGLVEPHVGIELA